MSRRPAFINNNMRECQKLFRNAVLNDPGLRQLLVRYIDNLNLQGQMNKNGLSEQDALQLLKKAIVDFTLKTHTAISAKINPLPFDQNDISNPINFQNALNNPNSLLSISVNDVIAELQEEAEITQEEMIDADNAMQAQILQDDEAAEEEEAEEEEETEKTKGEEEETGEEQKEEEKEDTEKEKEAGIVGAITVMDDHPEEEKKGEEEVESLFKGLTGKDAKFSPKEDKAEEEIFAPRPKPPQDEK